MVHAILSQVLGVPYVLQRVTFGVRKRVVSGPLPAMGRPSNTGTELTVHLIDSEVNNFE